VNLRPTIRPRGGRIVGAFNEAAKKKTMIRWKSVACGAAVFVAAHVVLVAAWRDWFQPAGDFPPWFLNSGRAVAFTAGVLFLAGLLIGLGTRARAREALAAGGNVAAGAVVAMCVVLAVTGPGTLFPIALTIGAIIAAVSAIVGALAGSGIGRR